MSSTRNVRTQITNQKNSIFEDLTFLYGGIVVIFRIMPIAPFLPTPFSDFSWLLSPTYQYIPTNALCKKVFSKYIDCLEAYGVIKGRDKCADLFFDINECSNLTFQMKRSIAIRNERMKQYREGKLKEPFEKHPPLDSYLYMF